MHDQQNRVGERLLLQVGAVAAIVGTILQVAAGTSQTVALGTGADAILESLAGQLDWLWPLSYLGFIFGALLWVGAVVALATTLTEGAAWALGRLAVPAVIVGATLHVVDGSLNAVGLTGLSRAWATATAAERAALAQNGELLLGILEGTWAGVITLFHGLPFVLAGLAVVLSRRYPAWLGWIGLIGGAGSLIIGLAMFFDLVGPGPAVPFAVILSLFMVILGVLFWTSAGTVSDEPALP